MNILFSVCFSTCAWKKWAYTFEGCSESKTKVMAIISTNHSLLRLRSTNQLHERKTKKAGECFHVWNEWTTRRTKCK